MITIADIKWDQLAAALMVLGVFWAIGLICLRFALARDFVTFEKFKPALVRIDKIEVLQGAAPTREVVKDIERRVEKVEQQVTEVQRTVTEVSVNVGSLKAGQDAIHREISGVGHQIELVMKHLLEGEKA